MSFGIAIRFIGLKRALRAFKTAPDRVRDARAEDLHELGRIIVRDIRRQFPGTLGVVSGDTRREMNYRVFRGRVDRNPILVAGPVGRKGNLLRIHEEGLTISRRGGSATYPRRPVLGRALRQSETQQIELLGRSLRVV